MLCQRSAREVAAEAKGEMKGKVAIITGATGGLGLHTAEVLYGIGMTVIVGARSEVVLSVAVAS